MNKKLALKIGIGALSLVELAFLLKLKKKLTPKVPVVDDNTVLLFELSYSPFCTKVKKIMDYKGIPYKTVKLIPQLNNKFKLERSGQSKVPFIEHKGNLICDSTKIAEYCEEISSNNSIYFEDDKLNKKALMIEDWADESLEPTLGSLAFIYVYEHPQIAATDESINTDFSFIDNNKEKIAPIIAKVSLKKWGISLSDKDKLKKRAREYLNMLLVLLESNDYLVGDKLSIADLTVASHLSVAEKIPYIYEDEIYNRVFEWQKNIFHESKRRYATVSD